MEYDVPYIDREHAVPNSEGEFVLRCRADAGPGHQAPFAQRYADVVFHRDRDERETTVIDLVEGEFEAETEVHGQP